jgi:hypothetical protein
VHAGGDTLGIVIKDFCLINAPKKEIKAMRKLKLGFVMGFLAVCSFLTFSGAPSASTYAFPVIYGDDWPERGWC